MHARKSKIVGRGAHSAPPNRFERVHCEPTAEHTPDDGPQSADSPARKIPTQFLPNAARTIITENDSPDVPFRYSINPYRGCEHGCAYCYARPGHETFGLDAGLDFETKILVKHDAAALLRDELCKRSWQGETIVMSGVTDCYQPAERELCLTRGCLEVLFEACNPVGIITKNQLVARDIDILSALAERGLAHVFISVTSLDAELARTLEPRTSPPRARLEAIAHLAAANVPVGVMVAPIIPGLTDHESPAILRAAREAGAASAGCTLLRLPLAVRPIFEDWLLRNRPLQAERVLALVRATRGGRLNDARFGNRMRGEGPYAEQVRQNFRLFARKYQLDRPLAPLDSSQFRPPRSASGQMRLF